MKWVAVQTADCRCHGRISDYAWRLIDAAAAAADERVTDHNRAYDCARVLSVGHPTVEDWRTGR